MSNWIPLTTVALVLACIRVFAILISSLGVLLPGGILIGEYLNPLFYADSALHIAILLYFALALKQTNESVWGTIAYAIHAFMIAVFMIIASARFMDTKIISMVSAVNIFVLILLIAQSFMVKNIAVKTSFKLYAIVILIVVVINMSIPYLVSMYALSIDNLGFTRMINLVPAVMETYIAYLFYQQFNSPLLHQNNDFESSL